MSVPDDRAASRATPLPEEEGTEPGAEQILRESEERIAGAARSERPSDDADQNRRSEETL
jgi:hypothetical protein